MTVDLGELIEGSRGIWESTRDVEAVLAYVRGHGGNKNDSITVLRQLGAVDKQDAKRVVHFSETWNDHAESDAHTHAVISVARQHAETTVAELVGHTCQALLAVPGAGTEVVALYLRADDVWYRMFLDAGVFFLDQIAPDPEDDLDDRAEYIDLASRIPCAGDKVADLTMTDGTMTLRFASGVACILREEDGRLQLQLQM